MHTDSRLAPLWEIPPMNFQNFHEVIRSLNLAGIFTCTVPGLGPLFRRSMWGRVELDSLNPVAEMHVFDPTYRCVSSSRLMDRMVTGQREPKDWQAMVSKYFPSNSTLVQLITLVLLSMW